MNRVHSSLYSLVILVLFGAIFFFFRNNTKDLAHKSIAVADLKMNVFETEFFIRDESLPNQKSEKKKRHISKRKSRSGADIHRHQDNKEFPISTSSALFNFNGSIMIIVNICIMLLELNIFHKDTRSIDRKMSLFIFRRLPFSSSVFYSMLLIFSCFYWFCSILSPYSYHDISMICLQWLILFYSCCPVAVIIQNTYFLYRGDPSLGIECELEEDEEKEQTKSCSDRNVLEIETQPMSDYSREYTYGKDKDTTNKKLSNVMSDNKETVAHTTNTKGNNGEGFRNSRRPDKSVLAVLTHILGIG